MQVSNIYDNLSEEEKKLIGPSGRMLGDPAASSFSIRVDAQEATIRAQTAMKQRHDRTFVKRFNPGDWISLRIPEEARHPRGPGTCHHFLPSDVSLIAVDIKCGSRFPSELVWLSFFLLPTNLIELFIQVSSVQRNHQHHFTIFFPFLIHNSLWNEQSLLLSLLSLLLLFLLHTDC